MARQTILKTSDYVLVQVNQQLSTLIRAVGDLESEIVAKRLAQISVDRPVFVTGLARSGTTMMLTLLANAEGIATHRYRDFPFLFMPLVWNWFQDRMRGDSDQPVERPHGDRIHITKESAEAFEEPLWQAYFPWIHDSSCFHVLGAETSNAAFEEAFVGHLRKMLLLRNGSRYLSKGNYNVARIEYLARMFPSARFVVPIRAPLQHVRSLVRQHELFCRYANDDPRVPAYLRAAGHYEFGPQRQPINLDRTLVGQIEKTWKAGDEWRGYAQQWAQVYGHIQRLREKSALAERIFVVRYEDACTAPRETLKRTLEFCALRDPEGRVLAGSAALSMAPDKLDDSRHACAVWSEVASVAMQFGYKEPRC